MTKEKRTIIFCVCGVLLIAALSGLDKNAAVGKIQEHTIDVLDAYKIPAPPNATSVLGNALHFEAYAPSETVSYQGSSASESSSGFAVQTPSLPLTAPSEAASSVSSSPREWSDFALRLLALTNAARSEKGLAPLVLDARLSAVALEKCRDMYENEYFDHTSPTLGSPFDMMKAAGLYFMAAAENIAMGQRTPEEVFDDWMGSEGHRKNILGEHYTMLGVGYLATGHYWTNMFAG